MRLNGWQRLWVVLAAVWLLALAWQFFRLVPGEDSARRNARYKALSEIRATDFGKLVDCMTQLGEPTYDLDAPLYQRCDEQSRGLSAAESVKLRQRIEELLPQTKRDLLGVQLQFAALHIGAWVASVALLYGMGWVAAWVRRGFRREPTTT